MAHKPTQDRRDPHGGNQVPMTAPFRFARINRRVHYPAWGNLVSHDVPFADGHNGSISIQITAKTPLMVGRGRDKRSKPGTVLPFRAPDGSLAISGSGLQGVIRSILEVATFGKLGPMVKDRRFGMRDIGKSVTARRLYRNEMTEGGGPGGPPIKAKVKAGWLVRGATGEHRVVRCDLARIEMDEIASGQTLLNLMRAGTHKETERWKDVPARYDAFLGDKGKSGLEREFFWPTGHQDRHGPHDHSCGPMDYKKCLARGTDAQKFDGTLILTGKAMAMVREVRENGQWVRKDVEHTKHMEFVFHSPSRLELDGGGLDAFQASQRSIPQDVWRDFLLIHEADKASGAKTNPNWQYWQDEFRAGRPVPVFYLEEGGDIKVMGTAQMFKLAMPLSNHDLLRNSDPEHVSRFDGDAGGESGRLDMASLIFGAIGGKKDEWFRHSLKRRASFDMARLTRPGSDRQGQKIGPVALLSPKPSYYPFYVRQPAGRQIAAGQPYAAYHDTQGNAAETRRPELAGVKIWPAASGQGAGLRGKGGAWSDPRRQLTQDEGKLQEVSSWLDAAPEGSQFATTLRVHNLREVELGALLWALSFGKADAFGDGADVLRHRLGGGKPYGLGEVEIRITGLDLDRNDGAAIKSASDLIAAFTEYMAQKADLGDWANSVQVNSLIKAATPTAYAGADVLEYIDTPKLHVDLRNAGWVLPAFAGGAELGRAGIQTPGLSTSDKTANPAMPATELQKGMRVRSGAREGVIVDVQANAVMVRLDDGRRERWAKVNLMTVS